MQFFGNYSFYRPLYHFSVLSFLYHYSLLFPTLRFASTSLLCGYFNYYHFFILSHPISFPSTSCFLFSFLRLFLTTLLATSPFSIFLVIFFASCISYRFSGFTLSLYTILSPVSLLSLSFIAFCHSCFNFKHFCYRYYCFFIIIMLTYR